MLIFSNIFALYKAPIIIVTREKCRVYIIISDLPYITVVPRGCSLYTKRQSMDLYIVACQAHPALVKIGSIFDIYIRNDLGSSIIEIIIQLLRSLFNSMLKNHVHLSGRY